MPHVNFNPRRLTAVFNRINEADTRFVLNYGGAGSSKSYSQAQFELYKALKHAGTRTLIIRKTARTLDDSVVELLKTELMDASGMGGIYQYNRSTRTLTLANGSQFLFRGIDDPEKIKSIQGIQRVWIEEASELTEHDFDSINLRLRGSDNIQVAMTLNPISEEHWIKKRFVDTPRDDTTFIHSTYEDNPFVDDAFIQQLKWYKEHEPEYYEVYGLGKWGRIPTGYEFYRNFSHEHIGACERDPELPLHVTFDFNVNPYMTCLVLQVQDKEVRQIDELCLESPRNNTEDTCKELMRRYKTHSAGVYLYGDPAGKAQDTRQKKGRNDFTIIRGELSEWNDVKDRVPSKAPEIRMRGDFINAILRGFDDMSFTVDENCSKTIDDLRSVKEEADGKKLKEKQKDPKTGVSMEMYGHASDALDYFFTSCFTTAYRRYRRGGKEGRADPTQGGRTKIKSHTW